MPSSKHAVDYSLRRFKLSVFLIALLDLMLQIIASGVYVTLL